MRGLASLCVSAPKRGGQKKDSGEWPYIGMGFDAEVVIRLNCSVGI